MRSSCLINVNSVKLKGRRQHCSSDNSFISVCFLEYFLKLLYEFYDRSLSEKGLIQWEDTFVPEHISISS